MSLDDNTSKIADILAKAWEQTNKSSEAIKVKKPYRKIGLFALYDFLSAEFQRFFYARK